MLQKISASFLMLGIRAFALVPFWLLYLLSDGLYFVFFYVIKYRYRIIKNNVEKSFPEYTEKEVKTLIKKIYRNLCDILLEGIKGLTMSASELKRRYKLSGMEAVESFLIQNRSAIMCGAHYANWEWLTVSGNLWFKVPLVGIYKVIKNPYIEQFMVSLRGQRGLELAPTSQMRQTLQKFENQSVIYLLVCDQSPSNLKSAYQIDFFNQKTAWLHGADSIARTNDFPVFYYNIQRVKRGFYEATVEPLCLQPKETTEGEIMQKYVTKLEQIIKNNPSDWLWSHKRWKHRLD